ncbi:MAG: 2,3-bisphosphoglycerate-independent phosphoglycerate mutase [Erysipelotrichia bacterium]|nr:2,3-bisphosphoglycerate-independent phosphoglycerate mutase [Erysipelotrichia bacterium]
MKNNKPIILCIMDGYGLRKETNGNAVIEAKKPNLDYFFANYAYTTIDASGEAVGLPEGQMGNSEVGHLNIGAGRIVYQSLTLINKAIKDGSFFGNKKYLDAFAHVKKNKSKLHILALISDGGVHSHISHVKALIKMAKDNGLDDVFVHCFMDGRDVGPQEGVNYINELQNYMNELKFGHIADIGGRYYGMDRDKNFDRVNVAYKVMVDHEGLSFDDYRQYFKDQYVYLPTTGKDPSDEFLVPAYNAKVDGRIKDDDGIIFMNFRPDRAIQISTIITNSHFYEFPPKKSDGNLAYKSFVPQHILKNIFFVCTMKYADSVKGEIAFALPKMGNILGVWLADHGYSQLRIAETEKYAHVTFFFDGTMNFDGDERPLLANSNRILINSPKVATYDLQPEMSAYKVRDALIEELNKKYLDVVIVNFANCDMVGHTAIQKSVVKAVEVVDECVGSLINWVEKNGGTLIVTADHGNAEEILDDHNLPFTAHTVNKVPFCISDKNIKLLQNGGKLANIAPTIIDLLGDKKPVEMTEESLIIK